MMCWRYLGILTLLWYQCRSNIQILYMSNDTSVSGESQHKDSQKVSNKNVLKPLFLFYLFCSNICMNITTNKNDLLRVKILL